MAVRRPVELTPNFLSPTALREVRRYSRRQLLANAAIAASRVGS